MNEIRCSCPNCGQNLEIATAYAGRPLDCPACRKPLIVPSANVAPAIPTSVPDVPNPPAPVPVPRSRAKAKSRPEPEAVPSEKESVPSPAIAPDAGPVTPAPEAPEVAPQIAVLTPALKGGIVVAIRERLADPARWLPGKRGGGKYQYAARREGRTMVPVEPTDPTATHLSLFGAVLLEFHRRRVHRASPDRREFLDVELVAAIREVLGNRPGGKAVTEAEREALTHGQSLAVLDRLERRYRREAEEARKQETADRIGRVTLADLVARLEQGGPILSEQVACALYHEVGEIQRRLERLEASTGGAA